MSMELTEKRAFFEAYGAIAGAAGVTLGALLEGRGLLRAKEKPETRACAALALGRVQHRRSAGGAGARRAGQGPARAQRREPRARGTAGVTTHPRRRLAAGRAAPRGRAAAFCSPSTPRSGASSSTRWRTPRCSRRWTSSTHPPAAPGARVGARGAPVRRLPLRQRHPAPARARQLRLVQQHPDHAARVRHRRAAVRARRRAAGMAGVPQHPAQPRRNARSRSRFRALVERMGQAGTRRSGIRAGASRRRGAERAASAPARWPSGPTPRASRSPRKWSTASGWGAPPASRRSSARCR